MILNAQFSEQETELSADFGVVKVVDTSPHVNCVKTVNGIAPDEDGNVNVDGVSAEEKELILSLFRKAAYTADMSATFAQLSKLWGIEVPDDPDIPVEPEEPDVPVVTLTSISATYSGGDVPVGTAVSALTGIVVTAHYSDGTSKAVTDYTLSGTIAEGNNTITVSYGGKTTTFAVTGVAEEEPHTHSYTSQVTKEASCETAGVRTYTCSCGHSYTEAIPATGHNYVDGTCTNCGAADPDYEEDVTIAYVEPPCTIPTDNIMAGYINNGVVTELANAYIGYTFIKIKPSTAYTIDATSLFAGGWSRDVTARYAWYDASGTFIGRNSVAVSSTTNTQTITLSSKAEYIILGASGTYITSETSAKNVFGKIMFSEVV